jgi:hypothetical protein
MKFDKKQIKTIAIVASLVAIGIVAYVVVKKRGLKMQVAPVVEEKKVIAEETTLPENNQDIALNNEGAALASNSIIQSLKNKIQTTLV